MYNLRAWVKAASAGSVRPHREVKSQALPATMASQVTPSQALEILDDDTYSCAGNRGAVHGKFCLR